MTKASPFFTFNGHCAEAMELYAKAMGAKVAHVTTYAKSKDPKCADPAKKDWIYHAQMKLGRSTLMLCDGDDTKLEGGTKQRNNELCLCVEFDRPDEVRAAFEAMKEGGKVLEDMDSAPYSELFAFVEDKFGIRWWLMTAE